MQSGATDVHINCYSHIADERRREAGGCGSFFFSLFLLDIDRGRAASNKPGGKEGGPKRRLNRPTFSTKEVPMSNIDKSRRLLERHFPMDEWKQRMKDDRQRPQISAGTIAQAIVEMVPRGQKSLLEVDHDGRFPEMRAWHESEREMVVSDSTAFRSLSVFDLEPVHEILWEIAGKMNGQAMLQTRLPSGRRSRIGALDGSQWGGFAGSVLTLAGPQIDLVAGYRMSRSRGHELAASRRVLKEAVQHLGKGFVDVVAVDGLYMTEKDFRWCLNKAGCHLLVKTDEETLSVVEDARGLFFGSNEEIAEGLEKTEGFDEERMCEY